MNYYGHTQTGDGIFFLCFYDENMLLLICWQKDLLVAVTYENVLRGSDPVDFLDRSAWPRAGWDRAGAGTAHFAALWSLSLEGFQTLSGVHDCDRRDSPSDLIKEHNETWDYFRMSYHNTDLYSNQQWDFRWKMEDVRQEYYLSQSWKLICWMNAARFKIMPCFKILDPWNVVISNVQKE